MVEKLTIEIRNLTKNYKELRAINNINLTLTPGIYGLLGPNGAGKSTLMNIIAGLLKPTEGEVKYKGVDVYKNRTYQQKIGYMPQQQGLYEQFSGYRYLSYIASLKGITKNSVHDEVIRVAKLVKLEDRLNEKLKNYSGGMKQRIMIAATLIDNPEIILLDEPTAGLDPKIRVDIRNMISELAKDKIILIATHVVQDVEFIAKEIIVLKKGELIKMAASYELVEKLDGKVYETVIATDKLDSFKQKYVVSNLNYTEEGVNVRFICEVLDDEIQNAQAVAPNLEDYYLYVFE